MNRRELIQTASVGVVGAAATVALAGCQTGIFSGALTQVITYVTDGVNAVGTLLADAKPYIPASLYTTLQSYYSQLQSLATEISGLSSITAASTSISGYISIFNNIVSLVAKIPGLPPVVTVALSALSTFLSLLESTAGIASAKYTAVAITTPSGLTLEQADALVIVKGLAARYKYMPKV